MFRRFLFAVFVLALIGCDNKTVVEPEPPLNQPPVIRGVFVIGRALATYPVTLRVSATDPDNDELTIIWEASQGTVDDEVWIPPDRATEAVLTVHVSDGINAPVSESHNITVVKLPPIPQPLPPQTHYEPPPVPDFEIWSIASGWGIEYVVPGKVSIKVSIGDTVEQVNALAERSEWLENDSQVLFHPKLGEFLCFYEEGKIVSITVNDARYKTPRGISVGSHVDEVIAMHGQPDKITPNKELTVYMYIAERYLFGILLNKRVGSISIV